MPGRVTSVAPSVRKNKSTKLKSKRSQNALALAEQEVPYLPKLRPSRLGQSEGEPTKRKWQSVDEDSDNAEDGGNTSKRRKAGGKDKYGNEVEVGSDNSGNEWTVGNVDDADDSDLDSDEALGDSDDEGAAIRGTLAHASSRKVERPKEYDEALEDIDLREDMDDTGHNDSDSFGDEAVDLADMLDDSDAVEDGGSGSGGDRDSADTQDEEAESILSFSEQEDDADDPAKLAALQAFASSMDNHEQQSNALTESGTGPKRKVSADLALSFADPTLRKSISIATESTSKRSGIGKKLEVPLPKRQQDRLDRAAAFEKSKETLNRWIDTIKHNRRADHLSFPLKDPDAKASEGSQRLLPKSQSKPLNDLENTIQNILQDSGLAGPNSKSEEDQLQAFEDLQTRKMPLEEVEKRRAELRRARELLFREEIRAKRIKKIKSKTYRKVHRKERERNAQSEKDALVAAGVDDSDEERERRDRRRAEERMGARHRESRWAKGVKDSGRAKWDDDCRDGVTEMARRNEELRRRIEGKAVIDPDDGDASSESDELDDAIEGDNGNGNTLDQNQLLRLEGRSKALEMGAKGSKLASMDFMGKAEAARKARNNAEIESLRREMADEETRSEDEDSEGPGRRAYGPAKTLSTATQNPKIEHKGELEEKLPSDEDGNGDVRKPGDDKFGKIVDAFNVKSKLAPSSRPLTMKAKRKQSLHARPQDDTEEGENPWLAPSKKGSNIEKKRIRDTITEPIISNTLEKPKLPSAAKSTPRSALKGARKAEENAKTPTSNHATTSQLEASNDGDSEDDGNNKQLPFILRNQKLVSQAFAGADVVTDFTKEKQEIAADEDDKIIDNTLPGWGSWTGAGISKKAEKRNKNKVLVKQPGIAKEKRQDAKLDRVIVNEKRVKKNNVYKASQLPHPFETRQQYERSLRLPVGPEWATKLAVQDATKPRILMKQGIIAPMVKPMV